MVRGGGVGFEEAEGGVLEGGEAPEVGLLREDGEGIRVLGEGGLPELARLAEAEVVEDGEEGGRVPVHHRRPRRVHRQPFPGRGRGKGRCES